MYLPNNGWASVSGIRRRAGDKLNSNETFYHSVLTCTQHNAPRLEATNLCSRSCARRAGYPWWGIASALAEPEANRSQKKVKDILGSPPSGTMQYAMIPSKPWAIIMVMLHSDPLTYVTKQLDMNFFVCGCFFHGKEQSRQRLDGTYCGRRICLLPTGCNHAFEAPCVSVSGTYQYPQWSVWARLAHQHGGAGHERPRIQGLCRL